MISIQSIMLVVLGILCASLVVLLIAPAYWRRAVRLTTQQLKETLPISEAEMRAQMDRIRAEYAMRVHRLETQKKEAKLAATRRLIEINRRDASITGLETDLERMRASLEENQNARRVLEQTVADRLPKVEQRLAEAKHLLFNRDKEVAAAKDATNVVKQAFDEATMINEQQASQINRLNMSLATRAAKRSPDPREAGFEIELALRSELEAMRAKTRDQSALISRLQKQIGKGFGAQNNNAPVRGAQNLSAGEGDASGADAAARASSDAGVLDAAETEMSQLKDSLVNAQHALHDAARGLNADDSATRSFEANIRKLTATNQDQAGEIMRLQAALATFEGNNEGEGRTIRDSKIALKARLNAVQVQAEQQSSVIAQLRTQLAAAHERTALQAQHFKTEMRRLGAGTMPAVGLARRGANITQPASLAARIADPVQTTAAAAAATPKTSNGSVVNGATNAEGGKGNAGKGDAGKGDAGKGEAAGTGAGGREAPSLNSLNNGAHDAAALPADANNLDASTNLAGNSAADASTDDAAIDDVASDGANAASGTPDNDRAGLSMIERLARSNQANAKTTAPPLSSPSSGKDREAPTLLVKPKLIDERRDQTDRSLDAQDASDAQGASADAATSIPDVDDAGGAEQAEAVAATAVAATTGTARGARRPKSRLLERLTGLAKGS